VSAVDAVRSILEELCHPELLPWLGPKEKITFKVDDSSFRVDTIFATITLESPIRGRSVRQEMIGGLLFRKVQTETSKNRLINIIVESWNQALAFLRQANDPRLATLAFQALNDEATSHMGAVLVMRDAMIEMGLATETDRIEHTLDYARSIAWPLISDGFGQERWSANDDYDCCGYTLWDDGPLIFVKRGSNEIAWDNCNVRIRGDMAFIDEVSPSLSMVGSEP